jgi:hypothetical protein
MATQPPGEMKEAGLPAGLVPAIPALPERITLGDRPDLTNVESFTVALPYLPSPNPIKAAIPAWIKRAGCRQSYRQKSVRFPCPSGCSR